MNHSRNWSEGNLFSFTFCDSANFPITARIHVFDESHRPFISFYLTILQKNQVSFFDIQPFGNFLQVYRVTIHSFLQRCQKVFLLLLLPGGTTTLHDCAVTEECEEVWNPVSINMCQSFSLMRHPRGKHRVDWQPSDSLPHLGFPAWKCLTISKATWFIPQK